MKTFRLRSIELLIILILVSACAKYNTVPPDLKPSYTKLEVLTRIQELQNTTITLSDNNQITKDKADLVVAFTVGSAKVIQSSTTSGWIIAVKDGWAKLKKNIVITSDSKLSQIWLIIDYMINSL